MSPRLRNWLLVFGTLLVSWILHPFIGRNVEAVMEKRGLDQLLNNAIEGFPRTGEAMSSYFNELFSGSGFWSGAFFIIVAWGIVEFIYSRLRLMNIRIYYGGVMPVTRAYIEYRPTSNEIIRSTNIDHVERNGYGDYTIKFKIELGEATMEIIPLDGTPKPKETIINAKNARVGSVRMRFKNEPDTASFEFKC